MKKIIILSCLIFALILTGCDINISFGGKDQNDNDKEYFDNVKDQNDDFSFDKLIEGINSVIEKDDTPFEGVYVIAPDASLMDSQYYSDEIGESYIEFKKDNTFVAYLGFGNYIEGTYTADKDTVKCTANSFVGKYSPIQNISASITFSKTSNAIFVVKSASESYTVKTTNMNDAGEWVFDGDTKEMPLTSFSENTIYTLYSPINY